MKEKLVKNWGLKIASLVFAFSLWLVVMNLENPTKPQTFSNIPVKFVNTEVLTDQGLIYEVLDNTSVVKNVTVYGPRNTVEQFKDDDIVAIADFDKLSEIGTIPIEFSTNRFNNEVSKIRGSNTSVKLNIERKKTARLLLRISTVGEVAEGYLLGNMVPDQNQIIVTGGESIIDTVDTAVAKVDVTDATAEIATYADVVLYDKDGEPIDSDALTQNVTSVRVGVDVLKTKNVPLAYSTIGTPKKGYISTGNIESDPETVLIAGNSKTLESVNRIEVPAEELNITGQGANLVTIVDIRKYLPPNTIFADKEFSGKATVTVNIEKAFSRTVRVKEEQIKLINPPEGYDFKLQDLDREFELTLIGLEDQLNALREEEILGYVDLDMLLADQEFEEWKDGVYRTDVKFDFAENIRMEEPVSVSVKVQKREK